MRCVFISRWSCGLYEVRWTICPNTLDTQLVYAGKAGGTFYNQERNGANYLCMPLDPDYVLPCYSGVRGHVCTSVLVQSMSSQPEAVMILMSPVLYDDKHAYSQESVLMIPAKVYCLLHGWTREYYGYVKTERRGQRSRNDVRGRTVFECVGWSPKSIPGSLGNQNVDGVVFLLKLPAMACPAFPM